MINPGRDIASPRAYSLPMVLLLFLSACTAKDTLAAGSSGYIANAEQRVAAVDWSKAETVNVALSEYEFSPSSLNFQEGHSYKLHLANPGGEVHDLHRSLSFRRLPRRGWLRRTRRFRCRTWNASLFVQARRRTSTSSRYGPGSTRSNARSHCMPRSG